MVDPLSEFISLLRPRAVFSKVISGAGAWAVRYAAFEQPSFCTVLEGRCQLAVSGDVVRTMEAGDFVLLPATPGFTMSGFEPAKPVKLDPKVVAGGVGEVRHGRRGGKPDVRMLGGYFEFESPDADLLVSLLPAVLHVKGAQSLATLVGLIREESLHQRPGRELVLSRLVEVLLIDALRATVADAPPVGLLRGLADTRLVTAIRLMHQHPSKAWTVETLAQKAAMSRSAFFERFSREVGMPPMEYLQAWRMALAKNLLRNEALPISAVAERVGYSSSSTFSTAFSRFTGQAPGRYARMS